MPQPPEHPRVLIIGLGNEFRGDDGVGRYVSRSLRGVSGIEVVEQSGEGTALMDAWKNAVNVFLVDAVHSTAAPGTIHRFEAHSGTIPAHFFHYSTHAFSLAEAVELARALDQLPPRLIIYGIEGGRFEHGNELSREVRQAAEDVTARLRTEIDQIQTSTTACTSSP
jgi:hydrogenase maturation protease